LTPLRAPNRIRIYLYPIFDTENNPA
jgi:hypothetical protein